MRFVLVDRLLSVEPGKRATASMVFPPDLPIFADHFPGRPIVPGTLVTEAMGQTGGWLLVSTLGFRQWPLLTMIDQAKFYKFVLPGDELLMEATIQASRAEDFEVLAEARVDAQRVARARFLFRVEPLLREGDTTQALEEWARQTYARLTQPCGM